MRVVLVDDDKGMLLVLKGMLAKIQGVELSAAFQDAQSAYDYLQANPVDLVISDIELADVNGISLAKQLLEANPQLHFVFISAHTNYALDAFDIYASDYIVKPVTMERLGRTIQRIKESCSDAKQGEFQGALSIFCLGGFDVFNLFGERINWISSKSEEVFAYLLIHNQRTVSRSRLQEDIFGDSSTDASGYLNTSIYQLRKALKNKGINNIVLSVGDGYRLREGVTYCDLVEIQRLMGEAEIKRWEIQFLGQIESLYKNDLFEGKGYLWAYPERERLKGAYIQHLRRWARSLLERGHRRDGIRILEKILSYDEMDVGALSMLMSALAKENNWSGIDTRYSEYQTASEKTYGIIPDKSIKILYESLKNQQIKSN